MECVGEAYDGEEALLKIKDLTPDVVILGHNYATSRRDRSPRTSPQTQFTPRPRIIVLTAFGKDDLIAKLTEYGVDYFIVKPFNLQMLAGSSTSICTRNADAAAQQGAASDYAVELRTNYEPNSDTKLANKK